MANPLWSDGTDAVLASLRASNRFVPTTLSFSVSRSVIIDGVTDPDEVIHVLPEVREPTRGYHSGIIITVAGVATTLVLAATDGTTGRLKVFADDGGVSDIASTKGWSSEGWEQYAIGLAQASLERRNSLRANAPAPPPEPAPAPAPEPEPNAAAQPESPNSVETQDVHQPEGTEVDAPGRVADRRLVLRHASRSDRGLVQPKNEDSVYAGPWLLAIADGMSQPLGGDVASQHVVAALAPLDEQPGDDVLALLQAAVQNGNAAIAAELARRPDLLGMATTVAAILFANNHFGVTSIGDTRCYLLREGLLTQLTRDDTVVQILVDYNQIAPEQADDHPQQGQLTRALNGDLIEPSLAAYDALVGDRYLLCTRGLWGPVRTDAIKEALSIPDVDVLADRLIELALQGGGPENVTVVVADVVAVET